MAKKQHKPRQRRETPEQFAKWKAALDAKHAAWAKAADEWARTHKYTITARPLPDEESDLGAHI